VAQSVSTSGTRVVSERFSRIKRDLLSTPVHLCPERAVLTTDYFKHHDDPKDPTVVRRAKALRHLLRHKSVRIFPRELVVGNMGSHRISALIQPELAGIFMSTELLWIDRRKTNPLHMAWRERIKLLSQYPYWLLRNMPFRAFSPHYRQFLRFALEQLDATYYLINEAGGIGHFLPNYEKMLRLGVKGYLESIDGQQGDLYQAVRIACEGLVELAQRFAEEAERQSAGEKDPVRAAELTEVARICHKVPLNPAETLHEALQSLWLTHMAVNLEGLNSAISFGRIDQYLYPYYRIDLEQGTTSPDATRELLLCFSAKCTEHVFLLSEKVSQYHGGYLVVQAAVVGGMDRNGRDAVNDLTYLFLDVMEEAGLRDPNYQARVHVGSPAKYVERVAQVAMRGNAVPAVFGDEAAIASLAAHNYPLEEARDYGVVGCVELALPGKSFFSTDAGLFNLPLCLELALNQGKRFKSGRRVGVATPDPTTFTSIEQVMGAFRAQVEFMVARMVSDLQVVEKGNRDHHPTPLSSMLVDGCLESGKDVTSGGALYNSSGVQGVGVADVADSLAALDHVVFQRRKYTMPQVLVALRTDFRGAPEIRAELAQAPKYGNDHQSADRYADLAARVFHDGLAKHTNTRGGRYVSGFYSVTCHIAFGKKVGALPSGRRAGEPLAASLGPSNGRDRSGPTALLKSVASVDSRLSPNGYALNLRFDPATLAGDEGVNVLAGLIRGFFAYGGMEMQLNVVDPEMLGDARLHPGKYPELVVRVSGYCAYFDDLPDAAKLEIISRTRLGCEAS
jgi:pyruvate formate-lyase/glycerol dehydratase family glycyl radical enzyme